MHRFCQIAFLPLALCGLVLSAGCQAAPAPAGADTALFVVTITPENAYAFRFMKNGAYFGSMDMIGWGPNWAWAPPSQQAYGADGVLDATVPFMADTPITLAEHVTKTGPNTVTYRYTLAADKDRALTQLSDAFAFVGPYNAGSIDVSAADGSKSDPLPIPTQRSGFATGLSKLVFHVKNIGDITATFSPAITPHVESGALRMRLAHDTFPAGTQTITMTLTFPGAVRLDVDKSAVAAYIKPLAEANWFGWKPTNDVGPSVIGMEPWLNGPAGKHGFLRMTGGHFAFADGTPVKFWGTNLAYGQNTPEKAQADQTAARFAKYGINCVRMHKFTNPGEGIGTDVSTLAFDPAGLDRLDYFTAQLKKRGVYYGWSHSYHYKVRAGDKAKLLNYDEIAAQLGGDTYGLINGAPDVQDVMISMVVALLKHKNPYTGLTYAQDPALAWLEVHNEDDIFFYSFGGAIDKCPTYKQQMRERFGAWLATKYGSQDALQRAWGSALAGTEHVGGPVEIQTNPWFFGDDNLPHQDPGHRQRLLDNALFFHQEQDTFYGKFVKAVRAAGFRGPINGSPWQAPATLPDLLNMKSDAATGYVDRHNYFDGGGLFDSMLADPGSGYLGSGLQQVAGHPFSLSEWCHVYPETLSAEGPAILAAYALGLQGWDASYEFQSFSTNGGFQPDAGHFAYSVWSADVPNQIGQFPALARMIARGDVKEGAPIAVRRVSNAQLSTGTFDFANKVVMNGDVKQFSGTVPPESLAAGRVLVQFTDNESAASTFPDLTRYGAAEKRIVSNTQQLTWDYAGKGYFTVATPGTVGVVGFAPGVPVASGNVRIRLHSPYASVFVTAIEPGTTLANCRTALVTAVARECNTGFQYFTVDNHVVDNGKAPILVEGVRAGFLMRGRKVRAVNILDQDGRLQPGRTVEVGRDGAFAIDTGRDKTLYYQVVFK